MTGAAIQVDINTNAVAAALARAAEKAADLTPLMDQVGASLVASTQQRFFEQAGPDGTKWPASIRAKLTGGSTLIDTTNLEGSITHIPHRDSVEVGTNVVYAAIHQFGGTIRAKTAKGLRFKIGNDFVVRKSVTIPARPFLGIDAADAEEITQIATDWMDGLVEGVAE
jgi:phage virion morphogenesis protein